MNRSSTYSKQVQLVMQVLPFVARQHPRDLFDVKYLLDNEGLTTDIRKALMLYSASHNRPMAELLRPHYKGIRSIYEGEFANMAEKNVPLVEHLAVRESLVELIHQGLTDSEKGFLISCLRYIHDHWCIASSGSTLRYLSFEELYRKRLDLVGVSTRWVALSSLAVKGTTWGCWAAHCD